MQGGTLRLMCPDTGIYKRTVSCTKAALLITLFTAGTCRGHIGASRAGGTETGQRLQQQHIFVTRRTSMEVSRKAHDRAVTSALLEVARSPPDHLAGLLEVSSVFAKATFLYGDIYCFPNFCQKTYRITVKL